MDAHQMGLVALLQQSGTRFWVPVFQRPYSWGSSQCEDLWRDIMRAGRLIHPHFMGTVLCSTEEQCGADGTTMSVIDGQQRLVTVSILLAALAERLRTPSASDSSHAESQQKMVERCLFIHGEPRLELGDVDQPAYLNLLKRCAPTPLANAAQTSGVSHECAATDSAANKREPAAQEAEHASGHRTEGEGNADEASEGRVIENYHLFLKLMDQDECDIDTLIIGLRQLEVIYATLGPDDQPQLVFESLNSKGMPLTNADLIRNALLVATDFDDQARLYERYWQPLEKLFDHDPDRITAAVHAWLAVRFRRVHVHGEDEVYHVFKMYLEEQHDATAEELLAGLLSFCKQFAGSQGMRERSGSDARSWIGHDTDQLVSARHLFGD
ncbi:MAG: DUF262 domain-containing protein [Eggerthellaceae bacterium]|jgi:hypothetical protein